MSLIFKLINVLPISWQALKEDGKIGKTVKKLAVSHENMEIKKQAKLIMRNWVKLVKQDSTPKSNKRRELENREEPPRKIQKISTSSAFRTKDISTTPTDLKVIKKTIPNKQITNTSNKSQSQPLSPSRTNRPTYKPLKRLRTQSDDQNELFVPKNTLSTEKTVSTETHSIPHPNAKPLASCIPKSKRRSTRSVSFAPKLVFVKYFPRDKLQFADNPNAAIIAANTINYSRNPRVNNGSSHVNNTKPNYSPYSGYPHQQQQQPNFPQMKPSIAWRAPPPIQFPSNLPPIRFGEKSFESKYQVERERSTLRAVYHDIRHIPTNPSADFSTTPTIRDDQIPKIPFDDKQLQTDPINKEDIAKAIKLGKVTVEEIQQILSNPTPENIAILKRAICEG